MILHAIIAVGLLLHHGEQASLQRYCNHESRVLGLGNWQITVSLRGPNELGPEVVGDIRWDKPGIAHIDVLRRSGYRAAGWPYARADQRDTVRHELTHLMYGTLDEETLVERISARLK